MPESRGPARERSSHEEERGGDGELEREADEQRPGSQAAGEREAEGREEGGQPDGWICGPAASGAFDEVRGDGRREDGAADERAGAPVRRRARMVVRVGAAAGAEKQAVRADVRSEAHERHEREKQGPRWPAQRHLSPMVRHRLGRMACVLLDIDGVLHVSGDPVPGAPEAVARLRAEGHRLRFVTNNTTRARAALAADLRGIGVELDEDEIETTALAAARRLEGLRVLPLTLEAVHGDLARHVELVDREADVVLVGGADETDEPERTFAWGRLDRAFAELEGGARLVCLHRNRWWQTAAGPKLDSGAVVAGLEYAAGVEAEVVGKPSAAYFEAALEALGAEPGETVMVGDDVDADVSAAIRLGLRGVLVRTGKFREATLAAADPPPDAVLDSIADLPDYLARRAESAA